jgi:hypothetical protein
MVFVFWDVTQRRLIVRAYISIYRHFGATYETHVEIKCQLDALDVFLLQIVLLAQHVSGTIMPIIMSSRVLYSWLLPVVFGALVFKLSVWCGAEGCVSGLRAAAKTTGGNQLYNTLEFLMMGIMVPETC